MPAKLFFFLLILGMAASSLGAFEETRGRLRVQIHSNGALSVWSTAGLRSNRNTPLFNAQDPGTSRWSVQLDTAASALEPGLTWRLTRRSQEGEPHWLWRGPVEIRQSLDFLTSTSSQVVDGLLISTEVRNTSQAARRIQLRYLMDTNLGEGSPAHFLLSDGTNVTSEWTQSPVAFGHWISRNNQNEGLLVMTEEPSTSPTSIGFANWKRLFESQFSFSWRPGRNFNFPPYSVNDSGVLTTWDLGLVAPGEVRTIYLVLGTSDAGSFAGARVGSTNAFADVLDQIRGMRSGAVDPEVIRTLDLELLDTLLAELDRQLASTQTLSLEELAVLESILQEMAARRPRRP